MRDALREIETTLKNKYQATSGQTYYSDEELLNPNINGQVVYTFN